MPERGVPYYRIYSAKEYGANNQNFDVICDNYGSVFLANFEGLLCYDGTAWRKVFTPGVSRVTRLARAKNDRIWIGGYNVFGYLVASANGCIQIKPILSDLNSKGNIEVDLIKPVGSKVYMHTTRGRIFVVDKNEKLVELKNAPEGIDLNPETTMVPKGLNLPKALQDMTVNAVTRNNKDFLWGATLQGVFAVEMNYAYTHFTDDDGLTGEVYDIGAVGNTIYICTQDGLYKLYAGKITKVEEIKMACWDLVEYNGNLLAPTSQGLYMVTGSGLKRLSDTNTLCVVVDRKTNDFITGEVGGMFRISQNGKNRTKLSDLDKVINSSLEGNNLKATTIYGSEWLIALSGNGKLLSQKCVRKQADPNAPNMITKDRYGRVWKTDGDGYNLKVSSSRGWNYWIHPLASKKVNTVFVNTDGDLLAGGDFGVILIDANVVNRKPLKAPEQPYIRQIVALNDSVFWGGYSGKNFLPKTNIKGIKLPAGSKNFSVDFSVANSLFVCPVLYRFRLNGDKWSSWSTTTHVDFKNMTFGNQKLEIQAKDSFGRESKISTVEWYIDYPFYLDWYAVLFYILFILGVANALFRWRTNRLKREKAKLEGIVKERTSELSDALDDLKKTQDSLVRMERTATAGKLTQGLIDRILNPINYINNFSKLTSGLAKDLKEDIEDEKENMSADNFDDCEDILDMMTQNLGKIEEHGVATTRTLRSMEAILNTHIGTLTPQNLSAQCLQVVKVAQDYHKEIIGKIGLNVSAQVPEDPIVLDIDADAMNRILLSMVTNSIYAVEKKYEQTPYNPEVTLIVEDLDETVRLTVHDNGIGVEDAIKDKIFDPFFTTKPTGVASGVGLYLVRELVHDHNANIELDSERGLYCNFIITFPKL